LRNKEDPRIESARTEIARIRAVAEDEIANSQTVIQRLRDQIQVGDNVDLDTLIDEQNERVRLANNEIDSIIETKFALQAEARKLEAEVGPVKYIAEFVYGGEADRDILEEAVRWVILTIIFVFDPLAVMLLIAAQYTFEWNRKPKVKKSEPVQEDPVYEDVDQQIIDDEFKDSDIEELLEKADPEVLQEVADELEKEVDKTPYDPYTDNREDSELNAQQLSQRHNMKLYSPDGRLASSGKTIKSIKIKKD